MARRRTGMMTEQLLRHLDDAGDLLLVDFSGLNSHQDFEIRTELRSEGLSVNVVKNSILKRVMTDKGTEFPEETYFGPLALILGDTDAITASKSIATWRRKNRKKMPLKGGVFEGEILGPAEAEKLTKMLSVEETRAAVV